MWWSLAAVGTIRLVAMCLWAPPQIQVQTIHRESCKNVYLVPMDADASLFQHLSLALSQSRCSKMGYMANGMCFQHQ